MQPEYFLRPKKGHLSPEACWTFLPTIQLAPKICITPKETFALRISWITTATTTLQLYYRCKWLAIIIQGFKYYYADNVVVSCCRSHSNNIVTNHFTSVAFWGSQVYIWLENSHRILLYLVEGNQVWYSWFSHPLGSYGERRGWPFLSLIPFSM